jgi:hypothetical protein
VKKRFVLGLALMVIISCAKKQEEKTGTMFKEDVTFLQEHTKVMILKSSDNLAQIAVLPDMQGRVMTSTANGDDGLSFGWINREHIASGENNKHINAFGGEDRIWFGPEGGQFSLFFKKGDPFDLEHWWTPEPVNEIGYDIQEQGDDYIHFNKKMQLANYSDREFSVELNRVIRLMQKNNVNARFGYEFSADLKMVAFESQNTLSNIGQKAWEKESGLISIWILGMYNPSPATTIVIPFNAGSEEDLGAKVNDAYFGTVPADRLVVEDDVLFFSGDGEYRSKIGLSPLRAKNVLGSYDAAAKVLTLVSFTKPDGVFDYVNSMWEIQDEPYAGDVSNSYNDGPPSPGAKPLGPFYELETSSPAAALAPGESLLHTHVTVHIQGDEAQLNEAAQHVLGVSLKEIVDAF